MPYLLPWTTSLRILPWTITSTRTSAITLSMSQMPWWMDWKCQRYWPVLRSIATMETVIRAAGRGVSLGSGGAIMTGPALEVPAVRPGAGGGDLRRRPGLYT
jgi:hypothetical protein